MPHRHKLSLDSATNSPTSPLSRAGSASANFRSPLSQLRMQAEVHNSPDGPEASPSTQQCPSQLRRGSRAASGPGSERNKPLPLAPFEPLVFRTPYRNRSARVRPSPVQMALVEVPERPSSPIQSQVSSFSGESGGDSDVSGETDATLRAKQSERAPDGSSSSCASSYVTAPPLSRVWSSPDIQWPAAQEMSQVMGPSPPQPQPQPYQQAAVVTRPSTVPPVAQIIAPTPITPVSQIIPLFATAERSPATLRRGKAISRRPSPATLARERAQLELEHTKSLKATTKVSINTAVAAVRGAGSSHPSPSLAAPSPQRPARLLFRDPLTPPASLPSTPLCGSSRRRSDTDTLAARAPSLSSRSHSTPLLSPRSPSSPNTQSTQMGVWAAVCQCATYLHVLLRASAFTQHMHFRAAKSATVTAMLAFLHARPDDPQQLCALLGQLGKALHGELTRWQHPLTLDDNILVSEISAPLLDRVLGHFATYRGFDALFTTSFAVRTTCATCATDVNAVQTIGWSAPHVWADSVCSVRSRTTYCATCARNTEHVMRSVPAVHPPLLLVEPVNGLSPASSMAAGGSLTKSTQSTYFIQPKMMNRAASKEWTLVGAVIPLSEGQLGFVATLDGVMTLFKGKQRLPIDLARPVPTPVFVLYEQ